MGGWGWGRLLSVFDVFVAQVRKAQVNITLFYDTFKWQV